MIPTPTMATSSPSPPPRRRPGQGTASVVGNQVQWNPGTDFDHLAAGATPRVVVSYSIQDEHGATSSSTVTSTVTGTNDWSGRQSRHRSAGENQTILVDVLANDTDVDDGARPHRHRRLGAGRPGHRRVVGNQVHSNPGTDFDISRSGATAVVVVSYFDRGRAWRVLLVDRQHHRHRHQRWAGRQSQTPTVRRRMPVLRRRAGQRHRRRRRRRPYRHRRYGPGRPGHGLVVGNQVEFDPGTDFDYLAVGESVVVNVSYSIEDEHGASASSTIAVTVTGTNDAPTIDAGGTTASGTVNELPDGDPGENLFVHNADGKRRVR
jgi:uncharacterized protein affecting Mg2+/Co2+ transport